jgi:hypothetical protein
MACNNGKVLAAIMSACVEAVMHVSSGCCGVLHAVVLIAQELHERERALASKEAAMKTQLAAGGGAQGVWQHTPSRRLHTFNIAHCHLQQHHY